jgi:hypothetical protein
MPKPLLCLSVAQNYWRKVIVLQFYAHSPFKSFSGDVEGALGKYSRSVEINRTASGLFNLGVTHYHLSMQFHALCVRVLLRVIKNSLTRR